MIVYYFSLNVLYSVSTVNDLQLIISEQSLAGGKSKGKSAQNFRKTCTHTQMLLLRIHSNYSIKYRLISFAS